MRLRTAAIAITAAGMVVLAFAWRHRFPFPDTIASHLPARTLAYVHVHVTPEIRRHLALHLARVTSPFADAVLAAVSGTSVRELALAWIVPDGAAQPVAALIIGQRRSRRSDVPLPETVDVNGFDVRTSVLRPRKTARGPHDALLRPLRHLPVQAFLRPQALSQLSGSPLRAAGDLLPEALTAAGTVDQNGLVLRSDRWRRLAWGQRTFDLPTAPRLPVFLALGFPLRDVAASLSAPPGGPVERLLRAPLPPTMDAIFDFEADAVTIWLPGDTSEDLVRLAAAVLRPIARPQVLDGFPTDVAVVDPNAVGAAGPDGRQSIVTSGLPALHIIRGSGGADQAAHDRIVLPRRCVDGSVYILKFIHNGSLMSASMSVSDSVDKLSICVQVT